MRFLTPVLAGLVLSGAVLGAVVAPASAAPLSPVGTWRVQDDTASIRSVGCGRRAFCGVAGNGELVLDHMRATGPNAWTGRINDSRSGSVYDGTISLVDERTLKVHGCMQGGGMCGDQAWTRAR